MPSLNLKTGKVRYSKADLGAVEAAISLCIIMAAHEPTAKKDAEATRANLEILAAHIKRQRNGA